MLACKETAVLHFFALAACGRSLCWLLASCAEKSSNLWRPWLVLGRYSRFFCFQRVLLFTWFGRTGGRWPLCSVRFPTLAARAGGEGHEKPFWYYPDFSPAAGPGDLLALGRIGILSRSREPQPSADGCFWRFMRC